ncbi:hypothetical protein GCM10025886_19140 [Tetragenococcus halophilus subsp. flandriensis]|uniref:hypothetical protein n=1 Tax=Tetragenococcus halophilus TaxID=51669 RepID=UPI0023E93DFB|nr:hypothetical protein [Tetragenococcus halophilus]GMA08763.1 hypothetical protein GCM10025886_19140 [Tetragenococcus halophilus subsp. flandriensis]
MNEFEYTDSLKHIFFQAYDYDKKLPDISLEEGEEALDISTLEAFIRNDKVRIYFDLNADEEKFVVFRRNEDDIEENKYCIKIETQVAGDKQKLKMLVNIIDQIMADSMKLDAIKKEKNTSYSHFLIN